MIGVGPSVLLDGRHRSLHTRLLCTEKRRWQPDDRASTRSARRSRHPSCRLRCGTAGRSTLSGASRDTRSSSRASRC